MKNNKMQSEKQHPGNSKAVHPENKCVNSTLKLNRMNHSTAPIGNSQGIAIKLRRHRNTRFLNHPSLGGAGGRLCKGPPGRQRSPGTLREHPPDIGITPCGVQNPVGGENPNNFENYFITNNKYNFLIHFLNFTKMKKQLFILILAVFASVTVAFGQAVHRTPATTLSGTGCSEDALHPIAGKPYNYGVGVSPTGGTFQWWATKATTFIENGVVTNTSRLTTAPGGGLLDAGTGYGTTAGTQTMSITWSSATLAGTDATHPTFVAVAYDDATNSCANNLKVYQIDPINGFTVDIANMVGTTTSNYGDVVSSCVSDVASAIWNGNTLIYNYGTTTLTYEVVAANFTDYFIPTFQLSGLNSTESATIEWRYKSDFSGSEGLSATSITNGTYTSTENALVGSTVSDTSTGVSIFVRLVISHNASERITANPITLAVDARNAQNQWDVVNADCSQTTAFEDTAVHNLNPRPAVTPTLGGFVPANTQP
jgi:hypothetical protein